MAKEEVISLDCACILTSVQNVLASIDIRSEMGHWRYVDIMMRSLEGYQEDLKKCEIDLTEEIKEMRKGLAERDPVKMSNSTFKAMAKITKIVCPPAVYKRYV